MTTKNRPSKHSGGYVTRHHALCLVVVGPWIKIADFLFPSLTCLGHGELRPGTEAGVFAVCHEL